MITKFFSSTEELSYHTEKETEQRTESVRCSVSFSSFFELYHICRYVAANVDMILKQFQQCNVQGAGS